MYVALWVKFAPSDDVLFVGRNILVRVTYTHYFGTAVFLDPPVKNSKKQLH